MFLLLWFEKRGTFVANGLDIGYENYFEFLISWGKYLYN